MLRWVWRMKEVVQLFLGAGELAESGLEEGLPEVLFDGDRRGTVSGLESFASEGAEYSDFPLPSRASDAEVLFDILPRGYFALERDERLVAQPFVEGEPSIGVLQHERVWVGRVERRPRPPSGAASTCRR